MEEDNRVERLTFRLGQFSRLGADHPALPSMVVNVRIELTRCANLALEVYKASPHTCAIHNKLVVRQGFEP